MTTPLPPQRLARAFVELAGRTVTEPSDPSGLLATLAAHGSDLLGCCAAAVRYRPDGRSPAQLAVADEQLRGLEADALTWGEGPGHDAQSTGHAVPDLPLDDDRARHAWPRYTPRALALGYRRAAALPLFAGTNRSAASGALVLVSSSEVPLFAEALALGQALTDAAGHTLARDRELRESRALADQLKHALASRIVIEQAKGVLAAGLSVSVDEAFTLLRGHARSHRRRLPDVARDVVDGLLDLAAGPRPTAGGPPTGRRPPDDLNATANRPGPDGGR